MHEVKAFLSKLGLSDKEAAVYLALLELGPSSVQRAAQVSGVHRATTYLALEALCARGLAACVQQGKKTLFAAESPQRLLALLVDQASRVEEQKTECQTLLPRLLALYNALEHKPKLRFFEGEEALDRVREELADSLDSPWEVYAVDEAACAVANLRGSRRVALTRRLRGARLLMAIKPGCTPPYFEPQGFEVRTLDYIAYPFSGSVTVSGQKVCLITRQLHGLGILIENSDIANMLRALYEAAWQGARPWKPTWDNKKSP